MHIEFKRNLHFYTKNFSANEFYTSNTKFSQGLIFDTLKTSPVDSVVSVLWTAAAAAITTTCFQWNYLDFDWIFSFFSLMNFFHKIKVTETAFKWKTVTLKMFNGESHCCNSELRSQFWRGNFAVLHFDRNLYPETLDQKKLYILWNYSSSPFKTKKMPEFDQRTRTLKLSGFNSYPSFYHYWRQKNFSWTILFRIPDLL